MNPLKPPIQILIGHNDAGRKLSKKERLELINKTVESFRKAGYKVTLNKEIG